MKHEMPLEEALEIAHVAMPINPWGRAMKALAKALIEAREELGRERIGGAAADTLSELDWNRLRSGDYRALSPEHRDVFRMVQELREVTSNCPQCSMQLSITKDAKDHPP